MRTRAVARGVTAVLAIGSIVFAVLYLTLWAKDRHGGKSDDEQIREVVAGMEVAYNSSDIDAWRKSFCEGDQPNWASLNNNTFGVNHDHYGRATATIGYIVPHGETATVHIVVKYGKRSSDDIDHWTFVREDDDWKACVSKTD
jgi:hypothetical protein